ncbi:uncharacterized protein HMPREF1541_01211 [Cyphellophora europaea CBS 101466]|uniref:alpha-1,2-Mannosidase n=1 Tax=Cyphellophora europaea (strain CBS 101466) TaxID=1220924 RepID=W2SE67_CYPE1|nr:uncharacterized protein HMPREF1541_01211 [Cyphellophora europaea CBS 101466]ETN47021.1 hypothetical protein HMPREF1541_01211 [Cyphellophora europaea CBS 101466]
MVITAMRTTPDAYPWPPRSLSAGSRLTWAFVIVLYIFIATVEAISPGELFALRKETEDLFYHGYENYMNHAFPEDELRPLTCKPLTRDRENPGHFEINDALGNYSLTLIDSLSTLAVLASSPSSSKRNKPLLLFQDGVQRLVEQYGDGTDGRRGTGLRAKGFDLDSKVQVFETAIRGLGGLLSAHLFAVGDLPIRGYSPPPEEAQYARAWQSTSSKPGSGIKWKNGLEYDGQLLRLAHDLGQRLLPAFWTQTGIPYPRVNLRSGIPFYAKSPLNFDPADGQCELTQQSSGEITETCSAGAGSLVVEFTVLSRLTGDPRFEELAKRAFWAIWNRRSAIGLIGAGIDAETGNWVSPWTGIGAGIDSFFEYAFKSFVLLSRDSHPVYKDVEYVKDPRILFGTLLPEEDSPASFYEAWSDAQAAVKRHIYRGSNYQHPHYIQVDLHTGAARGFWIDALSAFYPGVLALAGQIEEAIETHLLQTALWTRFSALPERWNLMTGGIEGGLSWWVGRPEFIESNYHIYRATEDPWYLYVAEMTLRDIKRRCWARCGWASIQNVLTGEQTDRMESFFLGETAKYLFLTFDPDHPLNHLDEPMVFSTEGHPLLIPRHVGGGSEQGELYSRPLTEPGQCPIKQKPLPFSISATAARGDVYNAAYLARLHMMPTRDNIESVLGEYATDHPAINLADLSSPSNYTYFPWTLPPSLVPYNATTALLPTKPTFDISFPQLANQGLQPSPPLQRLKEGILINHIGGLKLGMIQDVPSFDEQEEGEAFRIQAINNLALGKDEKVYLSRETGQGVLSPSDPNFTRIRDTVMLDLVVDVNTAPVKNTTSSDPLSIDLSDLVGDISDSAVKSAWGALVNKLSSIMDSSSFPFPIPSSANDAAAALTFSSNSGRKVIPAITATGLGAAPIPAWPDVPATLDPKADLAPQQLPWTRILTAGDLCTHKLPLSAPREHQILLVKRGGCAFAQKLANIPLFAPSPSSLQLVVVVSYGNDAESGGAGDEEDVLIRPLLEARQVSSTGVDRREGIPLVMVGGGEEVYQRLKSARGVGVRRRWEVRVGGVKVDNLIIL